MKHVLIIGSGLSGLTCAISLAEKGISSTLVSAYPPERAQSVMAAGGINACFNSDDSPEQHAQDTIKSGGNIAGKKAVEGLTNNAKKIIEWLGDKGVVFTKDNDGNLSLRALGGQTYNRTVYAGSSTGKQIMTALIRESRKYECNNLINRLINRHFYSALIKDGKCYGALLFDQKENKLQKVFADAVVIATGGQNLLFGKTTGSTTCDGYAVAKLYEQGARLKNLEFIQYHPTTIETSQKRMLISEAVRGEGGRLYYNQDGKRVYFMEDRFGKKGNLMPRDVVAKCIYDAPSQVYLDVTFLGKQTITSRLLEVYDVCKKYANIDITKQSIPVYPSVHFFMGGLFVDGNHQTSIANLYAIGECASRYHGANRLGGNSLLVAVYSAMVATNAIQDLPNIKDYPDFDDYIITQRKAIESRISSKSNFSAVYIRHEISKIMKECLGITRSQSKLEEGIKSIDYYLSISQKLVYDEDVSVYIAYSLRPMLLLARAILTSALMRKETRGAHIREDYLNTDQNYESCSVIDYIDGQHQVD